MRKTVLTASLAVLIFGAAAARYARNRVAAEPARGQEAITWGATDPAWAPDGKRIAFSLFGSIWQVPPEGGLAEQVTTSAGYHAHPVWSPQGDKIAFIRGNTPWGAIPNIEGRLVLVNVAGGGERELETPHPAAGTPAWSPDGSRIICGLRVPNVGCLLHEITLADGRTRRLQFQVARFTIGNWVDTAWNPKRNEIFFSAKRIGAPQVWSMPSDNPPVMIQLPLTGYQEEDIVILNKISSMPDGSAIVYSADVVNGKGDFELYRVPRTGGKPEAISDTPRDEFSPDVSPDGRRIVHVSNHLGNIDLFLMPVAGGEKTHVAISGLKFRGPAGRVRVKVHDALGNPTRARIFVRASDGKAYTPPGAPIHYYSLDPRGERLGFFIAAGDDSFPVPAGPLQLVAVKGVEYRLCERTVQVAPGETAEVSLMMERWTDWNQRGWYTGENHFHANYNGSYYQRPQQTLAWLEAEDLNVANLVVANSQGAFIHDKEFFRGAPDPLSTDRYILYWNEEYRNSNPLGHMAFLNLRKLVPPFYTSVIGSDSPYDFPLNTMAALEARAQGGFVSYVHPNPISGDVFDGLLTAKESPVTAALGAMDSIDILPFSEGATQIWYRFLNCGFNMAPGAGTDVFTNWRGTHRVPGEARVYVDVGPKLTWERWVERYREGRNFVTNGPLLKFDLNGQPLGARLRVPAGQPYRARLRAEATARTPLDELAFVQNGRIIDRREVPAGQASFRIEKEVLVDRSSWFAVRATGKPARGIPGGGTPRAHSAAIYVEVGGQPTLIREDIELMIRWIDRLWSYLEERNNFGPGDNRERARKMIDQARGHYVAKLAQAGG